MEIFVGIAVVTFVVLAVFIILTLIKFNKTIDKMDRHANKLVIDFSITNSELIRTLSNCSKLSEHINEKIQDLDPLFCSINKVGLLFKNTISAIELNHSYVERERESDLKITAYAELADAVIKIYKQSKKRK